MKNDSYKISKDRIINARQRRLERENKGTDAEYLNTIANDALFITTMSNGEVVHPCQQFKSSFSDKTKPFTPFTVDENSTETEQELSAYIEIIRRIATRHYGKEIIFRQNDGTWYSREHCRCITLEELEDLIMKITDKEEYHD